MDYPETAQRYASARTMDAERNPTPENVREAERANAALRFAETPPRGIVARLLAWLRG